jgi:O-antigen/teichoic acid export membrane protein
VAIVVLAANVVLVRRQVPLRPAFERAEWSRVVRLSVTYAAATAVGTIYLLITVVLTSLVGTSQETGYYGISFRIFLVVVNIPVLVVTSALPVLARAARDDRKRLSYALQRLLEIGAVLGVWIALVLVFGAEFAIKVVGGPKYAPAVGVLQIQGVAIIGTFIAFTLGFVLLSLGESRALLIANALALALSIALTLALVPAIGAKGAAIATVAGEFGLALLYGIALFGRRLVSGVSGRFVGPVALAAAPAAALALIPGLHDIPLVVASTAVYFVVLAALGGIPAELRAAFSEVVVRARA